MVLFASYVIQPRFISYFGKYQYTAKGQTMPAKKFHPDVLKMKKKVEDLMSSKAKGNPPDFNCCHLDRYDNGLHHYGEQAVKDRVYGEDPTVAILSLGAERPFILKSNVNNNIKHEFPMPEGAVLVMRGTTQKHWVHLIPKDPKFKKGGKINLTFRTIVDPEENRPKKKPKTKK